MQHYGRRHFQPAPRAYFNTTRNALHIMYCLFLLEGVGITSVLASPMGMAVISH